MQRARSQYMSDKTNKEILLRELELCSIPFPIIEAVRVSMLFSHHVRPSAFLVNQLLMHLCYGIARIE